LTLPHGRRRCPALVVRLAAHLGASGIGLVLSGTPCPPISCRVLDYVGREVARVSDWHKTADGFAASWRGSRCPAGAYFFLAETPAGPVSAKALLLR